MRAHIDHEPIGRVALGISENAGPIEQRLAHTCRDLGSLVNVIRWEWPAITD